MSLGVEAAYRSQQKPRCCSRIDVCLLGIKEPCLEAPREIGLELRHVGRIEQPVSLRDPRETGQLAPVARMRHDQRAVADDAGERRAPYVERAKPEILDDRRRRLALAERGEHGAGIGTGGLAEQVLFLLDEVNGIAAVGEL